MTIYPKPVKHISTQHLTSEMKFPTNIPLPCAHSISSPCQVGTSASSFGRHAPVWAAPPGFDPGSHQCMGMGHCTSVQKKSLSGDATASILHQAIWSSNKSTLGLIPHKWYDPLHSLAWPQPCMLFIICPGPLSVSSTLSSSVTPATQSFKPKPRLLIFFT
jgi:hypothetical protein